MKLWTWHKHRFSLIDGCVDHERSEYVQTVPGVRQAYRELAYHIGTDQIIWCYTSPVQYIQLSCHTEVEWVLDVPSKQILRFVDDIIWNRIIGRRCALLPLMRFQWKDEALRRFPHDPAARRQYEQEQEDLFWDQKAPGGNWWNCLFVKPQAKPYVSTLVRHPVKPEWVEVNPLSGRC